MTSDDASVLIGDNVRLRPLAERDIGVRARFGRSREIVRSFGGSIDADLPMTKPEARTQLHRRFGPGPHWVIADRSDQFIGTARLAPLDAQAKSARFAIGLLDPERLGQGLGSEAIALVVDYGFRQLKLHQIELTVLADNARAISAYKKCGFEEIGRIPEALFRDGRWYDDLHMLIRAPGRTP